MSIIFGIFVVGTLVIIANLLNEILSELQLAKRDREDARSQRTGDDE